MTMIKVIKSNLQSHIVVLHYIHARVQFHSRLRRIGETQCLEFIIAPRIRLLNAVLMTRQTVALEEFQERDSGWALSRILNLTVNVNKYNPLHAGCHIKFSREIMLKRTVINIQTADNVCFACDLLLPLSPGSKKCGTGVLVPARLNLAGIEFPMMLNQIKKFETLNDISINVYTNEKELCRYDSSNERGASM